jgi:hypothetical protein
MRLDVLCCLLSLSFSFILSFSLLFLSFSQVNELWALDISTYEWLYINTSSFASHWNTSHPGKRELHSSTMINGNLLIFGGKSRYHAVHPSSGFPILTNSSDIIYNDMWILDIDHLKEFQFLWRKNDTLNAISPVVIPQNRRYYANIDVTPHAVSSYYPNHPYINMKKEGVSPRSSQCIKDVAIEVTFKHDCINQLRFSLQFSGPTQGSPNYFPNNNHEYEILLLSSVKTYNTTNCISGEYTFIFHDSDKKNVENTKLQQQLYQRYSPSTRDSASPSFLPSSSSSSSVPQYENSNDCCFNPLKKVHFYTSVGKLSEMIDNTLINNYTLIVEDMKEDTLQGSLLNYHLHLSTISCQMRYEWRSINYSSNHHNVFPVNKIPSKRYNANLLTYNHSIFIFGGKNERNEDLHDLYRYDLLSNEWFPLIPVNFFSNPFSSGNAVGSNFLMTSYGLLRFGGYYRQPYLTKIDYCEQQQQLRQEGIDERCLFNEKQEILSSSQNGNYDNNVFLMDPITFKWQLLNITMLTAAPRSLSSTSSSNGPSPLHYDNINSNITNSNNFLFYQRSYDTSTSPVLPTSRYYSSAVFVPSSSLSWKQNVLQLNESSYGKNQYASYDHNERILYDNYQIASQLNYQSTMADSLLLFGGFDSAVGSSIDGSSGGFLQDSWLLRLNSFSTKSYRQSQNQYIAKNCRWRSSSSAKTSSSTYSCLTVSSSSSKCQLRDLLMLIWCSQLNQTLS